jgi:hypothetical protein
VRLLETYSGLELTERLPELFLEWERWAADVLDSHVAYPVLGYFRSSHDNLSWISAVGTLLDAASLVLTTIEGLPRGEAELFRRVGSHLVEDISNLGFVRGEATRADSADLPFLDRAAFDAAWARLREAGYDLVPADEAWPAFALVRATYAARLKAIATFWAMSSTAWLGSDEVPLAPAHPQG